MSSANLAYSLPSFDLGIDYNDVCFQTSDVVDNSVSMSKVSKDSDNFLIMPKVSKRARLDKCIAVQNSANHVSVNLDGKHFASFAEIHSSLYGSSSLQSTSLISGIDLYDIGARLIMPVVKGNIVRTNVYHKYIKDLKLNITIDLDGFIY